jgi:hypothetical protein
MSKYKIKATYNIIEGYRECFYEIEAESYEDAISQIEEGAPEPISIEDNIEECEIINYENI